MAHYRKITVGETEYEYVIGFNALKVKGVGEISLSKLTGVSIHEIERGRWKKTFSVTPAHVAAYIKHVQAEHAYVTDEMRQEARKILENRPKKYPEISRHHDV